MIMKCECRFMDGVKTPLALEEDVGSLGGCACMGVRGYMGTPGTFHSVLL